MKGISIGDKDRTRKKSNMAVLDPIEENKDDHNEEGEDHNSHHKESPDEGQLEQSPQLKPPRKSAKKEREEHSSDDKPQSEVYKKNLKWK